MLCGRKELKSSQIHMDHKIPIAGREGFTNWDNFINGLFCEKDNWQRICITCHDQKTLSEQGERFLFRKKKIDKKKKK